MGYGMVAWGGKRGAHRLIGLDRMALGKQAGLR